MPSTDAQHNRISLVAAPDDAGQRLDRWLAGKLPDLSRSRVQKLIRGGQVVGEETIREPRTPVKPGVTYVIEVPPAEASDVRGEDLPLNILYEDDHLIVIDKPAGVVVHPSAGHAEGTLVNALIAHCGDSLSGIGGVRRPGIVHRLDKDTTGVLVVAKTDAAHHGLSEQFKSHGRDGRLRRAYLAFVWGTFPRPTGSIDANLARSVRNRLKVEVVKANLGRTAITHYEVLGVAKGEQLSGDVTLLRLVLETGRTHQIRVHLSHIGHPVLGDPTYGAGYKTRVAKLGKDVRDIVDCLGRQALHAAELSFEHPVTNEIMSFTSPLPQDLAELSKALHLAEKTSVQIDKRSASKRVESDITRRSTRRERNPR